MNAGGWMAGNDTIWLGIVALLSWVCRHRKGFFLLCKEPPPPHQRTDTTFYLILTVIHWNLYTSWHAQLRLTSRFKSCLVTSCRLNSGTGGTCAVQYVHLTHEKSTLEYWPGATWAISVVTDVVKYKCYLAAAGDDSNLQLPPEQPVWQPLQLPSL